MTSQRQLLLQLVILIGCVGNYRITAMVDYTGAKVFRVFASNKEQVNFVANYFMSDELYDIWRDELTKHGGSIDVLILSKDVVNVTDDLDNSGLRYEIEISDVEKKILETLPAKVPGRLKRNVPDTFKQYHTYDEIEQILSDFHTNNPSFTDLFSIGKTYENRTLWMMRIHKFTGGEEKPGMLVDGAAHAREWISPASLLVVINSLITGYNSGDPEIVSLVENVDWYILPVMNPDGYAYSHVQDRLWRKNRAPNDGSSCIGTDLNRNFPYEWGTGSRSSPDPCSVIYRGSSPGSAPETQAVMQFVLDRPGKIKAYSTIHNYLQVVVTRWSYTDELPSDYEYMLQVAQDYAQAMTDTNNVRYRAGTAPQLVYAYSGGSPDWMKGAAQVKYSFGVELRDEGENGFLQPPEVIAPCGEELFAGLKAVARHLMPALTTDTEQASTTAQYANPGPPGDVASHVTCSFILEMIVVTMVFLFVGNP